VKANKNPDTGSAQNTCPRPSSKGLGGLRAAGMGRTEHLPKTHFSFLIVKSKLKTCQP